MFMGEKEDLEKQEEFNENGGCEEEDVEGEGDG